MMMEFFAWADDAAPVSALMNPGLSQEDYTTLYDELMVQLERDARSMDSSALTIPTCFEVFDNAVEQSTSIEKAVNGQDKLPV